ncbi:HNH endonuclease [Corallococcus sp. CA054B]|uniref:HNH endonuclease n=1 Tax=Corallococcus sp. CA054B TaxID=2316734 RepID=UPI000EA11534|nr:HNH endonuclease [Corallococcus sp. CA054B]RKG69555.1 HNH endonuclease [Corallococcus sp. CA054B]
MRPVERGDWPVDNDGVRRTFSDYPEARGALIERMGEYCSFCEGRMNASLAVEHMLPREHHPGLARDWHNFLLACVNCNSTKSDKRIRLGSYYWPDRDNTARAFVHAADGVVTAAPNLSPQEKRRAERTLQLTGLDRLPPRNPRASDRRWQHRREAWARAEEARDCLAASDTPHMRRLVIRQATALGHWSIWMTVFADDADMRQRLITAFTGTARACFDPVTRPVPRAGGAL